MTPPQGIRGVTPLLGHPVVQAGLSLIFVRWGVLAVTSIVAGADSWGAGLLDYLYVVAWHSGEAIVLIGLFLLLWKLLPILRIPVCGISFLVFLVMLLLSLSDPFLQTIIGERLTPSTLRHFKGPRLFVSDHFWQPVKAYWIEFSIALTVLLAYLGWLGRLFWHRGIHPRTTPVSIVQPVALIALGVALVVLPSAIRTHQIVKPVEAAFLEETLGWDTVQLGMSDAEATARIRDFLTLPPGAEWLDSCYPLVYAPAPRATPGTSERPDIFLVVIESLRAENLRHVNPTADWLADTPNLSRLARAGVLFPRYIATGFPSGPGYISLTYGVWPHPKKRIIPEFKHIALDGLSQRLRTFGYRTMHAEGDPNFDRKSAWVDDIFSDQIDLSGMGSAQTQKNLVDHLIAWVEKMDARSDPAPLFGIMITPQPHLPYETPDDETGALEFGPSLAVNYQKSLAYVDGHLGRFFAYLDSRGRSDNTVVIALGDHANFTERGDSTGLPVNNSVWTSAIIYGPERLVGRPRVVSDTVSHIDIHPTILGLIGDRRPTAALGGDLLSSASRPQGFAIALRNGGTRIDVGTASLVLEAHDPNRATYSRALPFDGNTPVSPDELPLTPAEVADLVRIWTYLLESNRVWNAGFLTARDIADTACPLS